MKIKRYNKYTTKILVGLLCITLLLSGRIISIYGQKSWQMINQKTPFVLEEAVKINIEQESISTPISTHFYYTPNEREVGEHKTKKAEYADTTFTYQSQMTGPVTELSHALQTLFVAQGRLNANRVHSIFDSLLCANRIYAQSVVGITASSYTKLNDWSGDSTAIQPNYRTIYANQGSYKDINYHAYLHCSYITLWELMPQKRLCILVLCVVVVSTLLCWQIHKERKRKKDGIIALKNGDYRIRDVLFDAKEKRLLSEKYEIKLTAQLYELFLIFVKAEKHRVSKEVIKQQFWPTHSSSGNTMTSAINRLKTKLNEIDCAYTIVTDPENDDYYILLPQE